MTASTFSHIIVFLKGFLSATELFRSTEYHKLLSKSPILDTVSSAISCCVILDKLLNPSALFHNLVDVDNDLPTSHRTVVEIR